MSRSPSQRPIPAAVAHNAAEDELDLEGDFNLNDIEGVLKIIDLMERGKGKSKSSGAVSSTSPEAVIAASFAADANLRDVLANNDKKIEELQEEYVSHHTAQAPQFVRLYNEVSGCEDQLLAFENEVNQFQERLTSTAEYIAQMQSETVSVVHKINNRKAVGARFKAVYEALNECDTFCDAIAESKTVDDNMLRNLKQLESKLVLLDPNLAGSAVQQDIDPRLTEAAELSGDKLHAYLIGKFQGLAEPNTNVGLQQQALERNGADAFSFLWRYNTKVAEDLVSSYVRIMKEVYLRHVRAPSQLIEETNASSLKVFEPLVPTELILSVKGREQAARGPTPSAQLSASVSSLSTRPPSTRRQGSRSVSRAISDTFAKLRNKKEKEIPRRETNFVDNVNALRSLCITYKLMTIDPVIGRSLHHSTCWVFAFAEMCCKLVNDVINEQRFVDRFFFATGGSIENQEAMVRGVLEQSIVATVETMASEIPHICDTAALLCATRLVEVVKNYFSLSSVEMPLLLLSEPFTKIKAKLDARLAQLLEVHVQSLVALCNSAPFPPLTVRFPDGASLAEQCSTNPSLAEALRAHDIVRRFSILTGQLHFVNTLRLEGSRVTNAQNEDAEVVEGEISVFDSQLDTSLRTCATHLITAISHLAKRLTTPLSAAIFTINCLAHVVDAWEAAEPQGLIAPVVGKAIAIRSPRRHRDVSPDARAHAEDESLLTEAEEVSYVSLTRSYVEVQGALRESIHSFITLDISTSTFAPIADFVDRCSEKLGKNFFGNDDEAEDDDGEPTSAQQLPKDDLPFTETQVTDILVPFHKGWQELVQTIARRCQIFFNEGPRLHALVTKEYFAFLLTHIRKLNRIVRTFFNKPSIQAKVVGRVTFSHEIKKVVARNA